jgi:hypothetical protein
MLHSKVSAPALKCITKTTGRVELRLPLLSPLRRCTCSGGILRLLFTAALLRKRCQLASVICAGGTQG